MHIKYAVKGCEPRNIPVPSVFHVRNIPAHLRLWKLEQFVKDSGEGIGANRYCQECFSHDNLDLLELHDGTGCLCKYV